MSRSGYSDDWDCDTDSVLAMGRFRAQLRSATKGKRGQKFLKGILEAMDAMPEKKLYPNVLVNDGIGGLDDLIVGGDELVDESGNVLPMGAVCAMGAYAKHNAIDASAVDPEDPPQVAALFDVAEQLVCEIAYKNDECGRYNETPEQRFIRMRSWIASLIKSDTESAPSTDSEVLK